MPPDFHQMHQLCAQLHTVVKDYETQEERIGLDYQNEKKNIQIDFDRRRDEIDRLRVKIRSLVEEFTKISGINVNTPSFNQNRQLNDSKEEYVCRLESDLKIVTEYRKPLSLSLKEGGYIFFEILGVIFLSYFIYKILDVSGYNIENLPYLPEIIFLLLIVSVVFYNLHTRKIRFDIIILTLFIIAVLFLIPFDTLLTAQSPVMKVLVQFSLLGALYFYFPIGLGIFLQNKFIKDDIKQNTDIFLTDYENAFNKLIDEMQLITNDRDKNFHLLENRKMKRIAVNEDEIIHKMRDILEKIFFFNINAGFSGIDWNNPEWAKWQPSTLIPKGFSIGDLVHKQLSHQQFASLSISALHPFAREGKNLIFISNDEDGRKKIHQEIQSICLRLFATILPGMCNFIFIDPEMMGGNLHGFTTISDDKKYIINNHALTDSNDINQNLDEILRHINRINETKLQNTYKTIEDYNDVNSRLKEPYRILVFYDIPQESPKEIIQKVKTISKVGPKCGIYLILHSGKRFHKEFAPLEDEIWSIIEQKSNTFSWFFSADTWLDLCNFDLILDTPPENTFFNNIVEKVAVSIQSEEIIKFEELEKRFTTGLDLWMNSLENKISAPLGIQGTGKPFELSLDIETKVNVLISGPIGTGKSNLLHVLIMAYALKYSPKDLNFYLIDFKKSEFERFVNLPHVKVIGLESDPEYGLAILDNLVSEKDRRLTLFRDDQSRDIMEYRNNHPDLTLPRIIVVFDEYQKLLADDSVKSEALSKIEDLARQGRAAGIHLIFATQTVSPGLMNTATIDQFRLRIALKCNSDDDSIRIIGNKGAAHLQDKLGSAIFTDKAAGGVQFNKEFRVAQAPTNSDYKNYIEIMQKNDNLFHHPRVFRGFAPVKISEYEDLFLSPREYMGKENCIYAWLGEPIKIIDPVAAIFKQALGHNLSIITNSTQNASGMLVASVYSIISQSPDAHIFLIDAEIDEKKSQIWRRLEQDFINNITLGHIQDIPSIFDKIITCSSNPQKNNVIFLIIFGLQKIRDLRSPKEYGKLNEIQTNFMHILEQGPEMHIHSIIWCDEVSTFKLYFPRPTSMIDNLFKLRVAGGMNLDDSNFFLGNSIAQKKINHDHRCVFHQGSGENILFRPFDAD